MMTLSSLMIFASNSRMPSEQGGIFTKPVCLLGCDDDLVKFDDFRFELKNAKRAGGHIHKTSISEYREMVGKFKTKVKLVQSERADKLKEMERKQFQLTAETWPQIF